MFGWCFGQHEYLLLLPERMKQFEVPHQGVDGIECLGPADGDQSGGILNLRADGTIVDSLLTAKASDCLINMRQSPMRPKPFASREASECQHASNHS